MNCIKLGKNGKFFKKCKTHCIAKFNLLEGQNTQETEV